MIATGNIRVVAAFSIAVFLAVLGWKLGTGAPEPKQIVRGLPSQAENAPYIEEDTDGDDIPNWQETLLGTDPNSPDSNNNGITDKNEPKTVINNILSSAVASSTSTSPEDAIGSRLIGEYLYLKNQNAYTSGRGEKLGNELSSYINYNTRFTPYTESDMVVSMDTSASAIEMHRKALQGALDPFLGIKDPEFLLYAYFVKNKDMTALAELRERAALYQSVAESVLSIPAPRDIADVQLEIANSLSFFSLVLTNMVDKANDPIASLALLKTYNQSERYVQTTFGALTAYYREKLFNNAVIL